MDTKFKRPLSELFSAGNQFVKYEHIKSKLLLGNTERKVPEFTVLIPTFARPDLLMDAIQSVMSQTIGKSKYEILVVDNACDYSSKTCKKLESLNCENLFYYQNVNNLGMFGNWNRGFELARTKWVCILHDDDILYPYALEAIESTLEKVDQAKAAAVSPSFDFAHQIDGVWTSDKPVSTHFWLEPFKNRFVRRSMLRLQLGLRDDPVAPTCGTTFSRRAVVTMGGFPDQYKSDDMFFIYSLCSNFHCYSTKAVWGQYRWGLNDSLTDSTKAALMKETLIMNDYFLKFPQKGLMSLLDRWFRKRTKFLICVRPHIGLIDLELWDKFLAEYFPEWSGYKPDIIEKALYRIRSIIIHTYNLVVLTQGEKGGNYVKN